MMRNGLLMFVALGVFAVGSVQAAYHLNEERALIAYMKVKPGTEAQFRHYAQTVVEESRRESGNVRYQLHQSVTNPQQFVFYELFKSNADLQYHRKSTHVKKFLAQTKPFTVQFVLEEYAPEGEIE